MRVGIILAVFLFGLLTLWTGCEDPNPIEIAEADTLSFEERLAFEEDSISQFIEDQEFDSVFITSSGLRYIPVKDGNGTKTEFGDILTLDITGSLLDGIIFETTDDDIRNDLRYFGSGREVAVRNLPDPTGVPGLNEGLILMQEKSSAILILPSHLAFGSFGNFFFNVGPNRVVVFEITVRRIRR